MLPGSMLLFLIIWTVTVILLRARSQRSQTITPTPRSGWPRVAVIVPVTGSPAGMDRCIESLLTQDYPDYEVVFVTRKPREPAADFIRQWLEHRGRERLACPCRHVVSGRAIRCGQKNHNLLAGIAAVKQKEGVLAFFDASHVAPSLWLKHLVGPIARKEVRVTTGYHHVVAGDTRPGTVGRAVTVLILRGLQEIPPLTQPWGGSTAMEWSLFEELDIEGVWSTNVVDDVSLAARLQRVGIRVKPVPAADLVTPLAGEAIRGWCDWLTRQWVYLKFCLPWSFFLAGVAMNLLATSVLTASAVCLAALAGMVSLKTALPHLFFIMLLAVFGEGLRWLHPSPPPRTAWQAAVFLTVLVGSLCHARCWLAREIRWRGISYEVGRGGVVEGIREVGE